SAALVQRHRAPDLSFRLQPILELVPWLEAAPLRPIVGGFSDHRAPPRRLSRARSGGLAPAIAFAAHLLQKMSPVKGGLERGCGHGVYSSAPLERSIELKSTHKRFGRRFFECHW